MVRCNWFFIGLIILLSGCREQSEPKLELEGHWVVDHGFDDDCQVTASFFAHDMMALSFYSLVDDACQSEFYGIEDNAVSIGFLSSRNDYFNEEGNLAVDLQSIEHSRWLKVGLNFAETAAGLRGVIVSTENDSSGLLNPLLNTQFALTPVADNWYAYARGIWGSGCQSADAANDCEVLEFLSTGTALYRRYKNCNEDLICDAEEDFAAVFFALRDVEKIAEDKYRLDVVVYKSGSSVKGSPAIIVLAPGSLKFSGLADFHSLTRNPVVSSQ